jgi:hypothetical protein
MERRHPCLRFAGIFAGLLLPLLTRGLLTPAFYQTFKFDRKHRIDWIAGSSYYRLIKTGQNRLL